MTQVNQNFKMYRGNSQVIRVDLTTADGSPYDPLVGAVLRWRLAKSPYATEVESLIKKYLNDGITGATGYVQIALEPTDTEDLQPGLYYHELKVWDGDDVATAMVGHAVIRPSISMGDTMQPSHVDIVLTGTAPTRS